MRPDPIERPALLSDLSIGIDHLQGPRIVFRLRPSPILRPLRDLQRTLPPQNNGGEYHRPGSIHIRAPPPASRALPLPPALEPRKTRRPESPGSTTPRFQTDIHTPAVFPQCPARRFR